MRKIPSQARARDTIEMVFQATARLLERNGRAGLSTNAIAELARRTEHVKRRSQMSQRASRPRRCQAVI